ncbi:kynureninase [Streptomyces sp. B-S-A8]|uniref:Kynureninase n=1 Tax=Streptomyces solicavernae TaxID=3043614 RepID=A0ABT6RV78_9ACTN|nr:kynureninase [Streptomyces sp. B-S-A8]MDI3388089.1 kynureninase [Streptomyces sp. B-S-A8]
MPTTRAQCEQYDADDPLAFFREEFVLPEGVTYLDGNSLGALPRGAAARVAEMVETEWGQGLIRSWNDAGWFDKPSAVGERIAPLIGAEAGEVVVCDSTSVNLFKVFTAALGLRPDRKVVVSEASSFPTDLYMMEGATGLLDGYQRRLIAEGGLTVEQAIDEDVAVVVLSHVDYRTGRLHDMAAITELAHRHGALVVWDLCHTAGALPVRLGACRADFAVGCTYKYLNGGPGSPAFLYAAARHQDAAEQPLSGWHGHADPFAFTTDYRPADGITRFRCSTPHLLSYAPLEASLDVWERVDLGLLRAKSRRMTDLFIELVEQECAGFGLEIASPRAADDRGSQVAVRHADGYPVMRALIDRGVIGDFRAPDLMRFGFTPLYVRYVDVWDAVQVLREVLSTEAWRDARHAGRSRVT